MINNKNEKGFNDNDVAKLIANKLYNPSRTNEDFAVKLFIENLVLPKECKGYNDIEMESYIFNFMKSID